jgi:hypothetical protein
MRCPANVRCCHRPGLTPRDFVVYRSSTFRVNIYNLFYKKYWAGGGYSPGNLGEARNVALAIQTRF